MSPREGGLLGCQLPREERGVPPRYWRLGQWCPQATGCYVPRDGLREGQSLGAAAGVRCGHSLPSKGPPAASALCPGPESPACTPVWREAGRPSAREREEEARERERRVGLARPRSGGRLGGGSGPSEGWPGVQQWRPVGWAAVLTGQRPGLVVQGLGQVLNSEIMLVT